MYIDNHIISSLHCLIIYTYIAQIHNNIFPVGENPGAKKTPPTTTTNKNRMKILRMSPEMRLGGSWRPTQPGFT